MKRLILGIVVALLLMGGPAAADCTYQGVTYSEGARVCIHRTMFMCQGKRWVKTAERCWEKYPNQTRRAYSPSSTPPDTYSNSP